MNLCYKCFLKMGGDPPKWESITIVPNVKTKCDECDLVGLYVRFVHTKSK